MISVEIGELGEILIGQFLPSLVDFRLDIGAQLKVIHPDEPLFIDGNGTTRVKPRGEQAVNLGDAVFINAHCLHHLV